MRKICGFAMFWIAIGMIAMLFIESVCLALVIIGALLVCGYNLFCG